MKLTWREYMKHTVHASDQDISEIHLFIHCIYSDAGMLFTLSLTPKLQPVAAWELNGLEPVGSKILEDREKYGRKASSSLSSTIDIQTVTQLKILKMFDDRKYD